MFRDVPERLELHAHGLAAVVDELALGVVEVEGLRGVLRNEGDVEAAFLQHAGELALVPGEADGEIFFKNGEPKVQKKSRKLFLACGTFGCLLRNGVLGSLYRIGYMFLRFTSCQAVFVIISASSPQKQRAASLSPHSQYRIHANA